MCLILFSHRTHSSFDLILAANRDEYYERPSEPPAFWPEAPYLLAGRDLVAGGAWLGITKTGKLAAVTNYRNPASILENAPSRGRLVVDFLTGDQPPREYLLQVQGEASRYNGFNLLVGDRDALFWYSNRNGGIHRVCEGIYGISNRLLDTPWPKVVRGKELMAALLHEEAPSTDGLFRLLRDDALPADDMLPSTGVGPEWEKILSPIFIRSPSYGTRSSTIILIGKNGHVTFLDRTFNSHPDHAEERRFEFVLELPKAEEFSRRVHRVK
jgi:uncharacterized protein with NRDE domain